MSKSIKASCLPFTSIADSFLNSGTLILPMYTTFLSNSLKALFSSFIPSCLSFLRIVSTDSIFIATSTNAFLTKKENWFGFNVDFLDSSRKLSYPYGAFPVK
ncbi:hypothetical protein [Flavobacterium sp. XS2P24]|uniref:hypothetical protein n=1 Tax=Flavobacterium sp. XS2P24 TaxID=3041249 RepID=UPI0024A9FC13|nr:hypothetical protein [Flavobacterium sp. XS2P24]